MSEPTDTVVSVETPSVIIPIPSWRSKAISIIQIVSMISATIGSMDLIQAINVIPDIPNSVSVWFAILGTFLRFTAEPILKLTGDILDDGVKNDSFKINP